MPRLRHAQGRPGTRAIPADWTTTHAPVLAGTLPDTCTITHPGRPSAAAFDPATGTYPAPTAGPHFTGPCRLEALAGQTEPVAGDEVVPTVTYHLVLAYGAAPGVKVDDKVTTNRGTSLRVRALLQGSYAFERTLACTENQS